MRLLHVMFICMTAAGGCKANENILEKRSLVGLFYVAQFLVICSNQMSGVAQIRFYLVILWKSQEISLLIKVFCLLSDYSKTCTKCRSTIEDLFHKVSLKLVKR